MGQHYCRARGRLYDWCSVSAACALTSRVCSHFADLPAFIPCCFERATPAWSKARPSQSLWFQPTASLRSAPVCCKAQIPAPAADSFGALQRRGRCRLTWNGKQFTISGFQGISQPPTRRDSGRCSSGGCEAEPTRSCHNSLPSSKPPDEVTWSTGSTHHAGACPS